jgi:hypothetical protein
VKANIEDSKNILHVEMKVSKLIGFSCVEVAKVLW